MIELLTLDDLTEMMGLSRYHVRDVIVKKPDFPRPVVGISKPRWNANQVKRYLNRAQSSHNTQSP